MNPIDDVVGPLTSNKGPSPQYYGPVTVGKRSHVEPEDSQCQLVFVLRWFSGPNEGRLRSCIERLFDVNSLGEASEEEWAQAVVILGGLVRKQFGNSVFGSAESG
ncbi:unnamed protein product [Boreogadus saida]